MSCLRGWCWKKRYGAAVLHLTHALQVAQRAHATCLVQATRRVCAATFCIVLGCIILVTYGNHQSVTLTVQDMLKYYERCAWVLNTSAPAAQLAGR